MTWDVKRVSREKLVLVARIEAAVRAVKLPEGTRLYLKSGQAVYPVYHVDKAPPGSPEPGKVDSSPGLMLYIQRPMAGKVFVYGLEIHPELFRVDELERRMKKAAETLLALREDATEAELAAMPKI